jgi:CxxC motif-containing protein
MSGKKFPVIVENEDGWSDWIKPQMKGYKMACCDCGLVHKLDFEVIKQKNIVKEYADGNHEYSYTEVKNPKYVVMLRASRDNRSTGQHRRFKNKNKDL